MSQNMSQTRGNMEKNNFKGSRMFNNKKVGQKNHEKTKKTFDKKRYRDQKYNKKFLVNQWEEKRKKAALRHLNKELKKENVQDFKYPDDDGSSFGSDHEEKSDFTSDKPRVPFFSAKKEFFKKKQEKQRKREEFLRVKEEREEALKKYKQKKIEAYKKLSQKTKKGQPVMRGRMELLLEKIQKSVT